VDAIIERCGKPGMEPEQLDELVDAELRQFCGRFRDEPRATVFVQHIMSYYAQRKRAPRVNLTVCLFH